jgi:2-polyprenyl-3-methyl-5-hydroxy-6-metoxy-1,4-benzoquinol methylase
LDSVEKIMPKNLYNQDFFKIINPDAIRSAEIIVPIVMDLVHPKSIVDVGCGTGIWLSIFKRYGASKVLGIDGPYIEESTLYIPKSEFLPHDLRVPIYLPDTYDLAVCLEVAEHLPAKAARSLIKSLTSLSSVILFSAAIPGQTGKNHINEQWPDYWEELFKEANYITVDIIRPRI